MPSVDKGAAYLEEKACISMSWEHFQEMTESFVKRIKEYEANNGKIRPKPKDPPLR